ncbi:MAG: hypothetical protein R3F17_06905 [Planctomycetota bacterium]
MLRLRPTLRGLALATALTLLVPACASVSVKRSTKTSGTYVSTGWAVTIFSIDMPRSALKIARGNAADIHQANTTETHAHITPDWGWWNWIFDIVSVRKATVRGTWGFDDH